MRKKLDDLLYANGLERKPVPGDGNCFFFSLHFCTYQVLIQLYERHYVNISIITATNILDFSQFLVCLHHLTKILLGLILEKKLKSSL